MECKSIDFGVIVLLLGGPAMPADLRRLHSRHVRSFCRFAPPMMPNNRTEHCEAGVVWETKLMRDLWVLLQVAC